MPGDECPGIGPAAPMHEGPPFRRRIISSVGLGMLIPDRLVAQPKPILIQGVVNPGRL